MELYTPTPRSLTRFGVGTSAQIMRNVAEGAIRSIKRYAEDVPRAESKKHKTKKSSQKNKMKVSRGYGKGYYKGNFSNPVAILPKMEDFALTKGAGSVLETYGSVTGTEICWVGATTLHMTQLSNTVAKAILRKLLKGAGIEIINPAVEFQSHVTFTTGTPANSTGFTVARQVVGTDGVQGYGYYRFVMLLVQVYFCNIVL